MYNKSPQDLQSSFLGPLTQIWLGRIQAAIDAKKTFQAVADQCRDFYFGTAGFMWEAGHNERYFHGKLPKPTFQINSNKAFEFVSLIAPSLFWKYPNRQVKSVRNNLELTPELFGDPNNQWVMKAFQEEQVKEMEQHLQLLHANKRYETYLNWSQAEYPGGGLITHSQTSIVDALLTGMGCLWPGVYNRSGSVYTKSEYSSVDNLFIDADCHDPLWETAGYVMRRHVQPIWQVERIFDYPRGYLEGKGNYNSNEHRVEDSVSRTFDMIEWYEIWSKVGLGKRANNANHELLNHIDDQYGDNVYLCVAKNLEHPLNLHSKNFFEESAEQIGTRLKWHTPNFGVVNELADDGRWPVQPLIFNTVPNSPWPLAPLAPALGELIAINVLTSTYVDMSWENRKVIISCLQSAEEEVANALKSQESHVFVKINDSMSKSINEAVSIFQRPNTTTDILQALAMLNTNFDKRVGLSPSMYGMQDTQVRVAADVRQKSAAAGLRPAKMSDDVARWMTENATVELFLAHQYVEGQSVAHILGQYHSMLWDKWRSEVPISQVMLESKTSINSSEMRRPDKETDTANIQSLLQWYLPIAHQFGQETTNTEPLNNFMKLLGEATDMDTEELALPTWGPPPPDPEQAQMQKESQMAALQKLQSEAAKNQASAGQAEAAATKTYIDSVLSPMQEKETVQLQDLRHTEEDHLLKLAHMEQEHEVKIKAAKSAAARPSPRP